MMLKCGWVAAIVSLIVLVVGCGGGEGKGVALGPDDGGAGEVTQVGPMVVRTAKTADLNVKYLNFSGGTEYYGDGYEYDPGGTLVAMWGAEMTYLASTAKLDRIVFSSNRGGHYDLYICDLYGNNVTRLTNNNAEESYPAWSPDGTEIVFARKWPGQDAEICAIRPDGTGERALTNNSCEDWDPDWSPDGQSIVFVTDRDGNDEVYRMYVDGTGQVNLTNSDYSEISPVWSPSGDLVAYASNMYGTWDIFTTDPWGESLYQEVTWDDYDNKFPCWNWDEDPWYGYNEPIFYQSLRNGNNEIVSDSRILTGGPGDDECPSSSPDGPIAYACNRTGNWDIWLMHNYWPDETAVWPARWQVTKDWHEDLYPDLGSPTVQTQRVLLGPPGSDHGCDPVWTSAYGVLVVIGAEDGYADMVRIGVDPEDAGSLDIQPTNNESWQDPSWTGGIVGIEISANRIVNLREDAGLGRSPLVWDLSALDVGLAVLIFDWDSARLMSVLVADDQVYAAEAGSTPTKSYQQSLDGDMPVIQGKFLAVYDNQGQNLAPNGAAKVTLDRTGKILSVD